MRLNYVVRNWPLFGCVSHTHSDMRGRSVCTTVTHFLCSNADASPAVRLMQVEGIVDGLFVHVGL